MDITYKYTCDKCSYFTNIKQHYNNHLESKKHKQESYEKHKYLCFICKNDFYSRTNLWRHKQDCKIKYENINELEQKIKIQNEMIVKYKKDIENFEKIQNKHKNTIEYQEKTQIKKRNETMIKNIEKVENNIIEKVENNIIEKVENNIIEKVENNIEKVENKIQNNTNINLYLNQECGSAINFVDFIKSIIIEMSDIKMIGHVGYVDAISNIIKTNLKNQDITKRPIHCEKNTIPKKVHIRDQNKWKKNNKEVKYIINDGIYELDSKIMEGINCARYAGSDLKNEVSQMRKHSSIHTSNGKEQKKITETILDVVPILEQTVTTEKSNEEIACV